MNSWQALIYTTQYIKKKVLQDLLANVFFFLNSRRWSFPSSEVQYGIPTIQVKITYCISEVEKAVQIYASLN